MRKRKEEVMKGEIWGREREEMRKTEMREFRVKMSESRWGRDGEGMRKRRRG